MAKTWHFPGLKDISPHILDIKHWSSHMVQKLEHQDCWIKRSKQCPSAECQNQKHIVIIYTMWCHFERSLCWCEVYPVYPSLLDMHWHSLCGSDLFRWVPRTETEILRPKTKKWLVRSSLPHWTWDFPHLGDVWNMSIRTVWESQHRSLHMIFSKKWNFAIGRSEVTAASGSLNAQHSSQRNHLAQDFLRLDITWPPVKVIMDVPDREPAALEDEKQRLLALKDLGPQGHRYWSDKVLRAEASGHTDQGPLDSLNSNLPIRGPSCFQHPWVRGSETELDSNAALRQLKTWVAPWAMTNHVQK